MRVTALLLLSTPLAFVSADFMDSAVGATADCLACLATGGDGDCTDECDVIGNVDDAVHSCCDWWSCSECPPEAVKDSTTTAAVTTTTRKVVPPPKTTTTAKPRATRTAAPKRTTRTTAIYDSTGTSTSRESTSVPMHDNTRTTTTPIHDHAPPTTKTTTTRRHEPPATTTVRETRTSTVIEDSTTTRREEYPFTTTRASIDPSVIAIAYQGSSCDGLSRALTVDDLAEGGASPYLWDGCNAQWDNGSDVVARSSSAGSSTALFQSVRIVQEGVAVASSLTCIDDYDSAGSWDEVNVNAVFDTSSGCVHVPFSALDFNAAVARVYKDDDCTGQSVLLTVQDFAGGNSDGAWDACNGYWDNGTPIEYQSSQGTWLNSIQVYNGFSVTTATQCNDDYTYDTINYKDVVTSDSGCVNTAYDFNHLDFTVAQGAIVQRTTSTPQAIRGRATN